MEVKNYKPGQLITIPNAGVVRVTRSSNISGCEDCPFNRISRWIVSGICHKYCIGNSGKILPLDCYLKPLSVEIHKLACKYFYPNYGKKETL